MIIMIMMTTVTIISHIHSENTRAAYEETTKARNYSKQTYWAVHTYCGKY